MIRKFDLGSLASGACEFLVYDILKWLASGMTQNEILEDYPELTDEDINAALSYAAEREHRVKIAL